MDEAIPVAVSIARSAILVSSHFSRIASKYAREHQIPPYDTVELALEGGTQITRTAVENHARSRTFVRLIFTA